VKGVASACCCHPEGVSVEKSCSASSTPLDDQSFPVCIPVSPGLLKNLKDVSCIGWSTVNFVPSSYVNGGTPLRPSCVDSPVDEG
jgi:hypothetical protein